MGKLTSAERMESMLFNMSGGPHDGQILRLFRPDWEELVLEGGSYTLDRESDPWNMKKKAFKDVNKGRSNIPAMNWKDK